jgi:hypothetical protein
VTKVDDGRASERIRATCMTLDDSCKQPRLPDSRAPTTEMCWLLR